MQLGALNLVGHLFRVGRWPGHCHLCGRAYELIRPPAIVGCNWYRCANCDDPRGESAA